MKLEWTEEMGEISGMGGRYEEACRSMVQAGIDWVDSHPESILLFRHIPSMFGLIVAESSDGKELERVMREAGTGPTGAMMEATMKHVLAYSKLGREGYVQELIKGGS